MRSYTSCYFVALLQVCIFISSFSACNISNAMAADSKIFDENTAHIIPYGIKFGMSVKQVRDIVKKANPDQNYKFLRLKKQYGRDIYSIPIFIEQSTANFRFHNDALESIVAVYFDIKGDAGITFFDKISGSSGFSMGKE